MRRQGQFDLDPPTGHFLGDQWELSSIVEVELLPHQSGQPAHILLGAPEVEVIPGVTAACAAAASLGVPLPHRGVARSLHFITGHGADESVPAHDWTALTRSGGTLAAYMAARTLPTVASRLIAAGLPGTTPAVAVENSSRPDERRVFATLAELPRQLLAQQLAGPTLVLIGQVVGFAAVAHRSWLVPPDDFGTRRSTPWRDCWIRHVRRLA